LAGHATQAPDNKDHPAAHYNGIAVMAHANVLDAQDVQTAAALK